MKCFLCDGDDYDYNKDVMYAFKMVKKNLHGDSLIDFSKDKLGEDNYNKLKEYNNLFMDTAFGDFDEFVEILSGGKQKVINWYKGLQ